MNLEDALSVIVPVLTQNQVTPATIRRIVEEIKATVEEEKAAKEPKAPKSRAQVVLIKVEGQPDTGYAVQIEEGAAPAVVIDRIKEAAISFNRSPKGRRNPVRSIGETLAEVRGKHWKVADERVKTKVLTKDGPVQILTTDGRLD